MSKAFDWKIALDDLFDATVNQEPLEDAASLMAIVSASDPEYHEECMVVFENAISSANAGDGSIIASINKSGYQVADFKTAIRLLEELRSLYVEAIRTRSAQ